MLTLGSTTEPTTDKKQNRISNIRLLKKFNYFFTSKIFFWSFLLFRLRVFFLFNSVFNDHSINKMILNQISLKQFGNFAEASEYFLFLLS